MRGNRCTWFSSSRQKSPSICAASQTTRALPSIALLAYCTQYTAIVHAPGFLVYKIHEVSPLSTVLRVYFCRSYTINKKFWLFFSIFQKKILSFGFSGTAFFQLNLFAVEQWPWKVKQPKISSDEICLPVCLTFIWWFLFFIIVVIFRNHVLNVQTPSAG